MKKLLVLSLLLVLKNLSCFSQKSNEENLQIISEKSYIDIFKVINHPSLKKDSIKKKIYTQAFLLKAKKNNDSIEIRIGYHLLATISDFKNSIKYVDSSIVVLKKRKNYRALAKTYLYKAKIYGKASKHKQQIDMLIKANTYANTSGDINRQNQIKSKIASLKGNLGEYEESKNLKKEVLDYFRTKYFADSLRYEHEYILSLLAYGNALNSLHKLDSAQTINKEAIGLALSRKNSIHYYGRLLISSAVTHYLNTDYLSGLDSIKKFQKIYKKETIGTDMLVSANFYLGKIYLAQNRKKLSEKYFLKTDSIIFSKNYFSPTYIENSELLVKHYTEKGDIKKQLYYINRLLFVDSILNKNAKYVTKNISEAYTIPNLISEKQKIIKSLKKNSDKRKIIITVLCILCALLVIILVRNMNKKKLYEKRIKEFSPKKKEQSHIINDETTKRILDELSILEQSDLFLDKDFNLSILSEKLNTNTSYVSKIINEHKKKTFKQYLIDFRIKVLIENLEEKPIMRKYSIKALAASIGYTNASSFTRIFKNYMGISPSEYLNKKNS